MAAEEHAQTPGEYIIHHLTHFGTGKPKGLVDFSVINFDSVFFSIALGVLGCFVMWLAARKVTSGVPGRFQAAVEFLLEAIDNEAKGIVHNATSRKFVAPLALTVFVWVVLLNMMDLLPVDLLPLLWQKAYGAAGHDPEHAYLRSVPTADLSITMGLSGRRAAALPLLQHQDQGPRRLAARALRGAVRHRQGHCQSADLDRICCSSRWPTSACSSSSTCRRPSRTAMRLFGNMYAGELIFLLIAMLGGAFALSVGGIALSLMHIFAGTVWAIFHILIIILQAYVFMMLTLVYIGMAHDSH